MGGVGLGMIDGVVGDSGRHINWEGLQFSKQLQCSQVSFWQAIDVALSPSKRRRLSVEQPAPQQVADLPSMCRQLSVKQSAPSLYLPPPLPPAAVFP